MKVKRVLINKEKDAFYIKELNKDFHTQFGVIKSKDLNKNKLKTNTGKNFFSFDPQFIDLYDNKKRNAQIILKKDIGIIIAETGIGKDSVIVEAGGGSGALSCFLANIAKKVVSYEIREEFIKTIQENIQSMNLENIEIKNKDIKDIDEKNVDAVILDLLEPEKYVKKCLNAVKEGGFLVAYTPSVTQVISFVESVKKINDAVYLKTIEIIERKWKIEGKISRPEFNMLGHTGFLSFVRKL